MSAAEKMQVLINALLEIRDRGPKALTVHSARMMARIAEQALQEVGES